MISGDDDDNEGGEGALIGVATSGTKAVSETGSDTSNQSGSSKGSLSEKDGSEQQEQETDSESEDILNGINDDKEEATAKASATNMSSEESETDSNQQEMAPKLDQTTEKVLNHLLFHKSLIDEQDGGERIGQYVQMVHDLEKGIHIAARNPFDRAVSIAFELVMQQHFDPWDIDLVKFAKLYLKKARAERELDFVTAGRLVFMAWSILKMQSEEIIAKAGPNQDEQTQEDTWSPADLNIFDSTEDLDYTTMVMKGVEPPLQEMLRRQGSRPVTLIELVDAFDEARKEAEIRERMWELRKSRYNMEVDFSSKVHKEDLGDDICLTWSRITKYNGSAIPLSKLCDCSGRDREDMMTVFVSVLFLAHMKIVKLSQKAYPRGEIFVQNISNGEEDIADMIAQAVAMGAQPEKPEDGISGQAPHVPLAATVPHAQHRAKAAA